MLPRLVSHSTLIKLERHDFLFTSLEATVDDIKLKIYAQRGMMVVEISGKEKKRLINNLFDTSGD